MFSRFDDDDDAEDYYGDQIVLAELLYYYVITTVLLPKNADFLGPLLTSLSAFTNGSRNLIETSNGHVVQQKTIITN